MKTFFLGIDPGKSGGVAFIDAKSGVVSTEVFDEGNLVELCTEMADNGDVKRAVCCLEKVGARPAQGSVSGFNFGQNFGYIRGVLASFKIPYQEITPQKWKKEFGLNSDKSLSVEVCRKLFPDIGLLATPKCKKPHDGMAEALLMAEYARRKL